MLVCVCFACNAAAAADATIAAAMDLFVLCCSSVLHWLSCVWFVLRLFDAAWRLEIGFRCR